MTNDQKRKRIIRAKQVLHTEYRNEFRKMHWDIRNNRLYSHDRKLALEWAECNYPGRPESYENQKPSQGIVFLIRFDDYLYPIDSIG
jgi:hypothetical protein